MATFSKKIKLLQGLISDEKAYTGPFYAMVDIALATKCDCISFSPFLTVQGKSTSLALSLEEEKALRLALLELKIKIRSLPLKHNIDRALLRYKVDHDRGWKVSCYVGWFHARIRVDGSVVPCGACNILVGNLKENSFSEIWNSPLYRDFRRKTIRRKGLAGLSEECEYGIQSGQ